MIQGLAMAVIAMAVTGACAPTPSPTQASHAPAALISWCAEELTPSVCESTEQVALAAVDASGWTPTQIWISSGILCPNEGCLFDPNATYPVPMPPEEGQWVGSTEVAFAETGEHAGLQIARVGHDFVSVLIGYRVPDPAWCSGYCPTSITEDDPFQLQLVLPRLTWTASEPITGMAILAYRGEETTTIYGSASGVIAFTFDEVNGSRHVDAEMDAACAPHALDPATPINVDLFKSGMVTGNESDADFLRSFFADPEIHLPAGTWDIMASANFFEGEGCGAGQHNMRTSIRIAVTE